MKSPDQGSEVALKVAAGRGARSRVRMAVSVMTWTALVALGLFAGAVVLGVGGYRVPFLVNETDVTHKKPFADFVGRVYLVKGRVDALAWNDFPDKAKILSVSLTPPSARNRFVSYTIPLEHGQRVRVISAQRTFALVEFTYEYVVSLPGADLPAGIPITMKVKADGVPDPLLYDEIEKAGEIPR